MDRDNVIQEIRTRIKCTDFLEKSKNGMYCCPECKSGKREHGTGAVKYYESSNTYYCHSCGKGGDVLDLMQLHYGTDFNGALKIGMDQLNLHIDPPGRSAAPVPTPREEKTATEPIQPEQDFTEYYERCKKQGEHPAAKSYLVARGISQRTAEEYNIGFDNGFIIIPVSSKFYIARNTDPQGMRYRNPKGAEVEIFNAAELQAGRKTIFVTEGTIDALSVIEAGSAAIALNGTSNTGKVLNLLAQEKNRATMVICLDNDDPGRKAAQTLKDGLQRIGVSFIEANIAGTYKDPNEFLTADRPAFIAAVQEAEQAAEEADAQQKQETQQAEEERKTRTGQGMVDSFLAEIRTEKYKPIPTGITDIDREIEGGFFRQQLVLLGAAPGTGKTAVTQWIFEGMAKAGTPCIYLNLEMSREQMIARSISRIAAQNGDIITAADVLKGYKWTAEQEEAVAIAAEQYRQTIAPQMIYNPDGVTADLDSILQYIETEAQRAENAGLSAPLIVLDYLQIVSGREREDDTAIVKRAVSSLKKYAITHNTVVFVIIAHNRASNKTGTVTQESGRDTSALEYSADLQLGLAYTLCLKKNGGKDKDDLTPEERKFVTLKVTKGRFVKPGTEVDLYFDGATMSFAQISKAPEPQKWTGRK